jgi:hypothetical protein
MKKSAYLVFGCRVPVADAELVVAQALGIALEPHHSAYVGDYLLYRGPVADRLAIEPAQAASAWVRDAVEQERFPAVISVQQTEGRNVDKLARHADAKRCLGSLSQLQLLRDSIVEEP